MIPIAVWKAVVWRTVLVPNAWSHVVAVDPEERDVGFRCAIHVKPIAVYLTPCFYPQMIPRD